MTYAEKLILKKKQETANAMHEGMTFAGGLYAVALNNLYGFNK